MTSSTFRYIERRQLLDLELSCDYSIFTTDKGRRRAARHLLTITPAAALARSSPPHLPPSLSLPFLRYSFSLWLALGSAFADADINGDGRIDRAGFTKIGHDLALLHSMYEDRVRATTQRAAKAREKLALASKVKILAGHSSLGNMRSGMG